MGDKTDVWQGTLALMVLKTIEALGPLHGYGIARRIEQTSGNRLSLNYGTLYPALAEAGAGRVDHLRVGPFREQPQGQVLQAHARGTQAARAGNPGLGGDDRDPGAIPGSLGGPGMKGLRAWLRRVAGLLPNERRERELADEIESHLQMHVDDNIRVGDDSRAGARGTRS